MADMSSTHGQTINAKKPFNPLLSLRQHIPLILIVILIGSVCSIVVGIIKAKKTYDVEAVLNIAPSIPKILYRTEETMMLRSYEDWMRTQVNILTSFPILQDTIIAYREAGYVWCRPEESMKTAIARLGAKLKVKQKRDTQLITIAMSSSKKGGLSEIVNSVVKTFLESKRKRQEEEDSTKLKRLKEEKAKVQKQLDDSYQKLEKVSSKYGTAITEEKNLYVYIDALYDLKRAQNKIFVERINIANELEALEKKSKKIIKLDIEPIVNELVERNALLQDNLIQLNRKEQDIRGQMVGLKKDNLEYMYFQNRLNELHGQEEQLRRSITQKETRLVREKMLSESRLEISETSAQYEIALETEKQLSEKLKIQQRKVLEYNTAVLRASTTRQEIERLQASLNRINERIDQIMLERANPGRVNVMEWALPPEDGVSNRIKIIAIGMIGSIIAGCVLALGIGFMDKTINKPDEIQKGFGFPATGFVLDGSEDRIDPDQIYNVFKKHLSSFIYNQYSKIALNFEKEHNKHGSTLFMVLAPKDGYGVTSMGINVLAAIDTLKDRKLYIDLNFRSPLDKKIPFISGIKGVTDWAGQSDEIDPFIYSDPRLPFHVLSLGTVKELFPPVLPLSRFETLLNSIKQKFDYIFIDCPPLLVSNYSEGLVTFADVVVIVVEAGSTQWGELVYAVNLLDRLGTKVVSIILNRVHFLKGGLFKKSMDRFYGRYGSDADLSSWGRIVCYVRQLISGWTKAAKEEVIKDRRER
ncbi:MAG: AAA family ATPase [Thermodesulfobacteriota bacterium]|nr:AAA family ATPase [Thermodesulfobacteriota bacterium]